MIGCCSEEIAFYVIGGTSQSLYIYIYIYSMDRAKYSVRYNHLPGRNVCLFTKTHQPNPDVSHRNPDYTTTHFLNSTLILSLYFGLRPLNNPLFCSRQCSQQQFCTHSLLFRCLLWAEIAYQCNDRLRKGRFGFRIPAKADFSSLKQPTWAKGPNKTSIKSVPLFGP